MSMPGFSVVVPASTANLGPGFDSVGLALDLSMTVRVQQNDVWKVTYTGADFTDLSVGEDNLIVKTVITVAEKYGKSASPLKLEVESAIPLGKGFGSSASAIAAGIVIADHLLDLNLSNHEKVLLGSQLEGHADNVSAALLGGAVITYFDGETIDYIHVEKPEVCAVVLIPPKALATEDSRGLLPEELKHKEASRSSAAGSVLSAAIVRNDWQTVGRMMEKDGFHEPFRKHLFPDFEAIRTECQLLGAYGLTISGAGPSLFVIVEDGSAKVISKKLNKQFPYYDCIAVNPAVMGARVR